jgi:hypothetical protein
MVTREPAEINSVSGLKERRKQVYASQYKCLGPAVVQNVTHKVTLHTISFKTMCKFLRVDFRDSC